MDDTGSEWKRDGEKFEFTLYPNRYVFGKDSNRANEPYFLLTLEPQRDEQAPPKVEALKLRSATTLDPRMAIEWNLPESSTLRDAVGFMAWWDGERLPQYVVPALLTNRQVTMPLDPAWFAWQLDQPHRFEVALVDASGNQGPKATLEIGAQAKSRGLPSLLRSNASAAQEALSSDAKELWQHALAVSKHRITWMDPLDKVLPESGRCLPEVPIKYLAKNVLWDASQKRISLAGAAGEWLGVQLVVAKPADTKAANQTYQLSISDPSKSSTANAFHFEVSEYVSVPSKIGLVPDPLKPLAAGTGAIQEVALKGNEAGYQSWLIECHVAKEQKAGTYQQDLVLKLDGETLSIKLQIEVWPWQVPDRVSFLPEMNCYGLPKNDLDYYRVGHKHRVLVNRVPYYQSGEMGEGMAPVIKEGKLDFSAWDNRFGPLFDGSAFNDSFRGKTPIECFYLPMHENWPITMKEAYRGGYWAETAFPQSYQEAFTDVTRQFAQHLSAKGWTTTRFLGFLNNKVDFKKRGWSRGSSIWLLDEPASFQDFDALAYYGRAFHRALAPHQSSGPFARMEFRADISRPQWQRDLMDGVLQYNVISQSAFRQYHRLVMDRKWRTDQSIMVYGTTKPHDE